MTSNSSHLISKNMIGISSNVSAIIVLSCGPLVCKGSQVILGNATAVAYCSAQKDVFVTNSQDDPVSVLDGSITSSWSS